MRKHFLLLGALALIGTVGLSSCGRRGASGEDGLTPTIGENGNWFIGDEDTGVPATGPAGEKGESGVNGENGQTAWSNTILPVDGGYITPSVGSGIVGTNVSFTFHETEELSKDLIWVVDGETIVTDETTLTLPVKEGGYVVGARFGNVETVKSKEELTTALTTIQEGTNIFLLDADLDLTGVTFAKSSVEDYEVIVAGKDGNEKVSFNSSTNHSTVLGAPSLTFQDLTIVSKPVLDEDVEGAKIGDFVLSYSGENLTFKDVDVEFENTNLGEFDSLVYTTGSNVKVTLDGVTTKEEQIDNIDGLIANITGGTIKELDIKNSTLYGGQLLQLQSLTPDFKLSIESSTLSSNSASTIVLANYGWTSNTVDNPLSGSISLKDSEFVAPSNEAFIKVNTWGSYDGTSFTQDHFANLSGVKVNVSDLTINDTKVTKDNVAVTSKGSEIVELECGCTYPSTILSQSDTALIGLFDAAWGAGGEHNHYAYLQLVEDTLRYPVVSVDSESVARESLVKKVA